MVSNLFIQGRVLAAPLAASFGRIQAWLDGLLVRAETAPQPGGQVEGEGQAKSGFPVWAIIVVAVVLVLCLLPVCIIAILTLMGPAIGNVFSNIQEGI